MISVLQDKSSFQHSQSFHSVLVRHLPLCDCLWPGESQAIFSLAASSWGWGQGWKGGLEEGVGRQGGGASDPALLGKLA